MKEIAFGIDGAEGDPNSAEGTVKLYWKQFMADWRREHDAMPGNITLSVTNLRSPTLTWSLYRLNSLMQFIKYELPPAYLSARAPLNWRRTGGRGGLVRGITLSIWAGNCGETTGLRRIQVVVFITR